MNHTEAANTVLPPGSAAAGDDKDLTQIVKRASARLIPLLCLMYLLAYLDRFNIGFASLTMNQDLGLSMAAYGAGASMFFVGYILFEVPSNIIMARVGARVWIARIMVTWGLLSAAMVFVGGETSLYVLRFLLGVAEAGFLPGVLVYITLWFPSAYRARMIGMFQMAMPLTGVIGAPLSSLILRYMDGSYGLQGWKWLFLVEGLPSVFLGIACLWLLPSRPKDARWLEPEQKARLESVLDRERAQTESVRKYRLIEAFTNSRVLVLAVLFFCLVCGSTGVGFFLPQIVKDFGFSTLQIGVVTAIPYILSTFAVFYWSRRSDAKGDRIGHVAGAATFSGAGFLIAACSLHTPTIAVIGLSMACMGIFASFPVFWTLPTSFLTRTAAAASVAFINSFGNISGVVEPAIIGWTRDISGGFTLMLVILMVLMFIAAALTFVFARMQRGEDLSVGMSHAG